MVFRHDIAGFDFVILNDFVKHRKQIFPQNYLILTRAINHAQDAGQLFDFSILRH